MKWIRPSTQYTIAITYLKLHFPSFYYFYTTDFKETGTGRDYHSRWVSVTGRTKHFVLFCGYRPLHLPPIFYLRLLSLNLSVYIRQRFNFSWGTQCALLFSLLLFCAAVIAQKDIYTVS